MSEPTWKRKEREAAALVGATRTPLSGGLSRTGTRSDTSSEALYVEHKHRKSVGVIGWFLDAEQKARVEGKVPLVSLSQLGSSDLYVLLRPEPHHLRTLADEIEKARRQQQQEEGRKKLELAHHEEKPTWTDEFRGGHRE